LAIPERFGRFTVLRRLAVGGTAEISLARYDGIGGFEKLVALKRLLPSLCDDRSQVTQFLNEARISACLSHPNIVQTYEVGEVEGRYFIAMEYVPGEDLEKILRRLGPGNPMPLALALRVVSEVCGGLHYAHGRADSAGRPLQIVHRDVSPANVIVSCDGAVKLIDFGVAKVLDAQALARSGAFRGKFAYMSPEQCAGEPLDARSDIFSLGIVLYEATLGHRPFQGENQFQILRQITEGVPTPPSQVNSAYPPELEAIVLRALMRRREQRYPSALEMQADLEQFGAWRGYRASSVDVATFVTRLFSAPEPSALASGATPAAAGAVGRAAHEDLAEWNVEETTTAQERAEASPSGEEGVSAIYQEGLEALNRRDYRCALDAFRRVLARAPSHQLAREGLDRTVASALHAPQDQEYQRDLERAAELFARGDLARCRAVVEDVIGEVPISSPDRGVLRRISALLAERLADQRGPESRGA
jgi:tRNA A-37 threonylcarbamoyl transferase component Bud32